MHHWFESSQPGMVVGHREALDDLCVRTSACSNSHSPRIRKKGPDISGEPDQSSPLDVARWDRCRYMVADWVTAKIRGKVMVKERAPAQGHSHKL